MKEDPTLSALSASNNPNCEILREAIKAKVVTCRSQDYQYGATILPAHDGAKGTFEVGLVLEGAVEVQARIPRYDQDSSSVAYPINVLRPGDLIGEFEYYLSRQLGTALHHAWIAVSGVHSIYVHKVGRGREALTLNIRSELWNNAKQYHVRIVWFSLDRAGKKPVHCEAGERLKELVSRTFIERTIGQMVAWKPDPKIKASLRGQLDKELQKYGLAGWRLFGDIVAALQDQRMLFIPVLDRAELEPLGPWGALQIWPTLRGPEYFIMVPEVLSCAMEKKLMGSLILQFLVNETPAAVSPVLISYGSAGTMSQTLEVVKKVFAQVLKGNTNWHSKLMMKGTMPQLGYAAMHDQGLYALGEVDGGKLLLSLRRLLTLDPNVPWSDLGFLGTGGVHFIPPVFENLKE